MAAIDMVPEEVANPSRRGMYALAFGYTASFLAILLLLGGIEWFGRASDGAPFVLLALRGAPRATETVRQHRYAAQTPPQSVVQAAPPSPAITERINAGAVLVADPALIENTTTGPLPRIADDGRTPMHAYAPAVAATPKPHLAIVMAGVGIGAKATAAAIEQLPSAITLAFVPVAFKAQQSVNEARRRGHEVLLQIPMEPYDYPDSDPGPNTLRVGQRQDDNLERLTLAATRVTGYAGLMNLAGSRFMTDADSLIPILTFAARRGLLFFDSGVSPQSAGPQLATQTKTAYVQSTAAIDADPDPADIDRRLSDLETRARDNGSAAATASAYPVTIARIAAWAQGLSGRGFVLVPASAIVAPAK
jgi:uncharacterized protein